MGSEWEVSPASLLDVRLSLIFLRIWGWWPSKDWTTLRRTLYRCQTTFSLGTMLLFVLSEVLALFDRGVSLETHIANACLLIEVTVGILKVLILLVNHVPMAKLISRLSSMHVLHGSGVPQQVGILKGAAWKGNLVTAIFLIMASSTCLVWFFYPFIYVALTEDPCSLNLAQPHAKSELPYSILLSTNNSPTNYSFNEINKTLMGISKERNLITHSRKALLATEINLEDVLRNNSISTTIDTSSEIPKWEFRQNYSTFKRTEGHQQYPPEECTRPQVFPADSWFPFDTTRDPGYKIAYTFQIVSIHITCMCACCPDTMYATMFIYIAAQLKILNISITNVRKMEKGGPSGTNERRMSHWIGKDLPLDVDWTERLRTRIFTPSDVEHRLESALVACIKHHQDIISSLSELQSMISLSLLLQVVSSMCTICLSLFSVAVVAGDSATTLKFAIYLVGLFAQLFLICWFTDDIICESLEVYHSAFGCGWPDGSRTFRQQTLMLILRAQKPLVITAGKFYVMSRSTYLQIVQASYSVFTVLSNIKET